MLGCVLTECVKVCVWVCELIGCVGLCANKVC